MQRWKKVLLAIGSALFIILFSSMIILPDIVRDKMIELVRQNYNRELEIGKILIKPLNLEIEVQQLDLKEEASEQTFVSFERLQFSLSTRSLIDKALIIDDLTLDRPFVNLEKREENRFNYSSFIPQETASQKSDGHEEAFHFSFNNLQIKNGTLIFSDSSGEVDFIHRIDELELAIPFIGNIPYLTERYIQPILSLKVDGAPLAATGEMKPFDQSVETRLNLNLVNIDIPYYAAYFQPLLPFELTDGSLSTRLEISYLVSRNQQPELRIGGDLSLSTLRLEQQGEPLFFLPLMLANLDQAAPLANEYRFSELSFYNPQLQINRRADGRLNLLDLVPRTETATDTEAVETTETQSAARLTIAQLRLREVQINFNDATAAKPAPVGIRNLNIDLSDIQWPQAVESDWQLSGNWKHGGNFEGSGKLLHTPLALEGRFTAEQLDLTPANNYIAQDIRLTLSRAKLDTAFTFELFQDEVFDGKINGTLGLRNFSLTGISDELLRWESLQFDEVNIELEPLDISIAEVALNNYLARIQVQDNGLINLNQITEKRETKPENVAAESPRTEYSTLPALRIDELTLQGGEVSFVDRHLPQLFSTSMYELGGRVSGLTSEPGKFANVDLRGALENHSPLTISGKIAPLAGELNTELKVRFTDIELAPVTPYSGTYLGYSIDKGKLYLDLDYKIQNRQVTASNKIFLDQFSFGDAVESEEATALPVRLAVALLKNRKGQIKLDLPVSGSTDDPKFGIFSTVITLLKNLLIKAATAPFSLLASMFDGGEDFSHIAYQPGSAALPPENKEKLKKLAQMLFERPTLKLEISAFVDPEKDPEGYRKEQLKQRVEAEWIKNSTPRAEQRISDGEYLENLQRVYENATFPKPRNAFGLLKEIPSAEMEKLILANTRVGNEEMQRLASARAAAVQAELNLVNPDLKPRLFLKNAEIFTVAKKDQNQARVEFGIVLD
jgi:uncharacterized protein involved in outer membrane biogenesis